MHDTQQILELIFFYNLAFEIVDFLETKHYQQISSEIHQVRTKQRHLNVWMEASIGRFVSVFCSMMMVTTTLVITDEDNNDDDEFDVNHNNTTVGVPKQLSLAIPTFQWEHKQGKSDTSASWQ